MSFFDDDEDATEPEPPTSRPRPSATARPRAGTSAGARARPRSGGARRGTDPAVERRRLVAGGVLVVVVIVMILLISSCQAQNTRNSLENYNNSVSSLISRSDRTGQQVFSALASGKGGPAISQALAPPFQAAKQELQDAQALGVPGQMSRAQTNVVLALTMRADGISVIANSVGQVSASSAGTSQAISQIAAGTARFYASDVVYKAYATPEISGALHGDGIAVGGNSNIQINGGQFLTSLSWLRPSFIATELHTRLSSGAGSSRNSDQAGIHGDALTGVAVGSNNLTTSATNTVAGSPAPTFTISVLNGGQFNEYGVTCAVSVSGGPSGQSTIPETTPQNTSTCNVTLPSTVPPGTYQVTVTIGKVPGEADLTNNSATYSVQFQ